MYSSDPKADLCSDSEHKQPLDLGRPPDHLWACNTYAKVFHSYSQAAAQGFLSKSQWKKRSREPIPNCPAAMVVRRKGKSLGWDTSPILDDFGDGMYIVALDWWNVFHSSHTVLIESNHSHCQQDIVPNIALPHCQVAATELVVKQEEMSECQEDNNANSTIKKSSIPCPSPPLNTSIVEEKVSQTEVPGGKNQGFIVM